MGVLLVLVFFAGYYLSEALWMSASKLLHAFELVKEYNLAHELE